MSIESILRTLRRSRLSSVVDDWSDAAHRFITSNALITFASISAYKTFSSSAIECVPPSNFPRSWSR
ncbi:hypothetical protein PRIPAC_75727, partial [Pristionchus pacificus]|uniref:Uncharacterized protein n=1 Tax=Pristionchus pacificus TaxID=54126 RepID=A0A2A6C782_PRIPA